MALRWPGAYRWLVLAPAAVYALAAGYVLARQAVSKPSPAFEWPAEQAAAHQPALVAIALLVLVVGLGPSRPLLLPAVAFVPRSAELLDQRGERRRRPLVRDDRRFEPGGEGGEDRE